MPTCLLERPDAPFPMITDEVNRRSFLAGLGAVGMLTACGTDTSGTAPVAGSRVLVDDHGEIRLDAVPQRIVTIYEESTELIVALGLKPVGTGSNRLATTDPARAFDGYYLTPDQIGTPTFVGSGPFNLEAIAALEPDLILPGFPDDALVPALEKIAPVALYDSSVPGGWQQALRRLGAGFGREPQAAAAIDGYAAELVRAREQLAPIVASAPRVTAIYPNYSGGDDTLVFGPGFAFAAVLPELGFDLVGIEKSASPTEPFANISLELIADIDTDTIVAFGPTAWTAIPAASILSTLDVPVVSVLIRPDWPSAGPLTAGVRLGRIVEALPQRTAP